MKLSPLFAAFLLMTSITNHAMDSETIDLAGASLSDMSMLKTAHNNNDMNCDLPACDDMPTKGQEFIVTQKGPHEGKIVKFVECSKETLSDYMEATSARPEPYTRELFKDSTFIDYICACLKNYDEETRGKLTLAVSGNNHSPVSYIKKEYLDSYGYLVKSKHKVFQYKQDLESAQQWQDKFEEYQEEFYVHPSWLEKIEKQLTQ